MYRVTVNLDLVPLNFYAPLASSRNVDDTTWEPVLKTVFNAQKGEGERKDCLKRVGGGGGRCLFIGGGPPGILEYTLIEKRVRGPYPGKSLTYRCRMMGFEAILRLTNKVSSYT